MSLFFPQELTAVNARIREVYRPLRWRTLLPVESSPPWAKFIEDRKQRTFIGDPANLNDVHGSDHGLPEPSISVSNGTITLQSFGYAYSYSDDELMYAQKVGISLDTEKVDALTLGIETFLEKVASAGYTSNGATLLGLNTITGTTTATASNKASGGDTPWSDATAVEIVGDLHTLIDSVVVGTKERYEPDTIVLPLAQYQRANVVMSSALERTPLEIFRAQRPEVKRILYWNSVSAGTAYAWSSIDPYSPRMIIARELTPNPPIRTDFGWKVSAHCKIGGVVCRNPLGVAKMSGL
jgi:hypothetical protein